MVNFLQSGTGGPPTTLRNGWAASGAVRLDGETRVGNFLADAYRWATGADVGLQHTPGLRTGPPLSGPVTRGESSGLVPFDARVVVAEVSGGRLERILGRPRASGCPVSETTGRPRSAALVPRSLTVST